MSFYRWIVLPITIILLYYSSLFSELCIIDDDTLINSLRGVKGLDFKALFIPDADRGGYYRPVLMLSFILERHLHDLHLPFMHLMNILLHSFNSILVYQVVLRIRNSQKVALFTALVFGIHPLATESVNWISGRTDLLAGTFVLLSCLFIILYRESFRFFYIPLSIISLILGMLSKEVAVGFLPAALLLFIAKRDEKNSLKDLIVVSLFVLAAGLIYYVLRDLTFNPDPRIKRTFQMIQRGDSHVWYQFLAGIGFYIKKIFVPYPLNVAITEVDPLYGPLLGIPALLLSIFFLYRRTVLSVLFITGLFLILPSLPLTLSQIAWTPFAERYAYLPMAFILMASILWLERNLIFPSPMIRNIVVSLIILCLSIYTFSRNLTWQSNYSLIQDTIKKSPDFKEAQLLWGGLLMNEKRYDEAIYYFKKASEHFFFGYDERPDLYMAEAYLLKGDMIEASRLVDRILQKTKGKSINALKLKLKLLYREVNYNSNRLSELKVTGNKLFELTNDPMILYEIGKVYIYQNKVKEAKEFFCKAREKFAPQDPYRSFSDRLCRGGR
ncbi:MAG: glycosyltransferase family 39 protein [Thermodesulfovibrionales bacterium]